MNICKGKCIKYETKHKRRAEIYRNGIKRCQICDKLLIWDGTYCPCCGAKLRTKPRNAAATKLRERIGMEAAS